MIRLDDGLLERAERVARDRGDSLEHLIVEYLHHMVKKERYRRARHEMLRPFVERPTVSLEGPLSAGGDSSTEALEESRGSKSAERSQVPGRQ